MSKKRLDGKSGVKGLGTRPLGANPLAGSPLVGSPIAGGGLGGGQGLGALIPGGEMIGRLLEVKVEHIRPDPQQPRKRFHVEALTELADSIKANGILQPLIVSPSGGGYYQIIAGERRWRAAQQAGLHKVPVVSREVNEQVAFELALLENIQRVDLTPLEEAMSYKRLSEEFSLSHEQIAERTGKRRATISNALRLLKLPPSVLAMIDAQSISAGHGRALLQLKETALIISFAGRCVEQGWSVRELERQVKAQEQDSGSDEGAPAESAIPPWAVGLESALLSALEQSGVSVKVKAQRGGGAQLKLNVNDEESARRLLSLFDS